MAEQRTNYNHPRWMLEIADLLYRRAQERATMIAGGLDPENPAHRQFWNIREAQRLLNEEQMYNPSRAVGLNLVPRLEDILMQTITEGRPYGGWIIPRPTEEAQARRRKRLASRRRGKRRQKQEYEYRKRRARMAANPTARRVMGGISAKMKRQREAAERHRKNEPKAKR